MDEQFASCGGGSLPPQSKGKVVSTIPLDEVRPPHISQISVGMLMNIIWICSPQQMGTFELGVAYTCLMNYVLYKVVVSAESWSCRSFHYLMVFGQIVC